MPEQAFSKRQNNFYNRWYVVRGKNGEPRKILKGSSPINPGKPDGLNEACCSQVSSGQQALIKANGPDTDVEKGRELSLYCTVSSIKTVWVPPCSILYTASVHSSVLVRETGCRNVCLGQFVSGRF